MSATLPDQIEIPSQVLFQVLEGEAVLLNLESERYYGLDDIGTRLWQLLAENGDVNAALVQLQSEYDVEADALREDMAKFFARLSEAGLLKIQ